MAYSPLTDQQSGRVTEWGATKKSAYVVLVNPTTGVPYVASGGGGGGGGGFFDLLYTDDTGAQFVYRDDGAGGALTAFSVPSGAAYTPGANPRPWSPATQAVSGSVSVSNFPATQPVSGPLTDAQLRATAVPVSGTVTANTGLTQPLTDTQLRATAVPVSAASLPLPSGAATETTLSALNTKIPSQSIAGLLPVDTLGTPGTPRVQATSGTAASIVLTTTCRRISMYATTGTWYSISGTATATSHYIAAGERLDLDVPAATTVSVLQETTDGSVRITELV